MELLHCTPVPGYELITNTRHVLSSAATVYNSVEATAMVVLQ